MGPTVFICYNYIFDVGTTSDGEFSSVVSKDLGECGKFGKSSEIAVFSAENTNHTPPGNLYDRTG